MRSRRTRILNASVMKKRNLLRSRSSARKTSKPRPNALLQDNPLVAVHPPLLYIGFVGFSVPFAFAIAMLITGRVHERGPLEQRRWTVLAQHVRIELGGVGFDAFLSHEIGAGGEFLADSHIV